MPAHPRGPMGQSRRAPCRLRHVQRLCGHHARLRGTGARIKPNAPQPSTARTLRCCWCLGLLRGDLNLAQLLRPRASELQRPPTSLFSADPGRWGPDMPQRGGQSSTVAQASVASPKRVLSACYLLACCWSATPCLAPCPTALCELSRAQAMGRGMVMPCPWSSRCRRALGGRSVDSWLYCCEHYVSSCLGLVHSALGSRATVQGFRRA